MRELLVLLLVVPIGLAVVLSDRLSTFEPPAVVAPPITVPLPGPTVVAAAPIAPVPTVAPVPTSNVLQALFDAARSWLGTPYLFGGCSRRGIDCSCFVQTVLAVVGIHVPRTTVTQKAFDTPIPRAQIAPGDTLFFDNTCTDCGANPTHEGLYIGGGLMIEAGDPVQIASINTAYWQAHYDSAGRPPGL